jgi:hypothetical protein
LIAKAFGVTLRGLVPELLSRDEIVVYLREVGEILGVDGPPHVVILVGGALLAWHGLRESTHDVDSVKAIEKELADAALTVANRHGLAPEWLNARALPFRPGTLDEGDCEVVLEHGRLRVLEAPLTHVFLMKLRSDRSRDHADLPSIWPRTGFDSAQQAVDAYWQAYPDAPADSHLTEYVERIARGATS